MKILTHLSIFSGQLSSLLLIPFKFKEKQQVTEQYGLFPVWPLYPKIFSVCSKLTCMHFGSWDSAKEWNLTMPEGEIIQVRLHSFLCTWMQKCKSICKVNLKCTIRKQLGQQNICNSCALSLHDHKASK